MRYEAMKRDVSGDVNLQFCELRGKSSATLLRLTEKIAIISVLRITSLDVPCKSCEIEINPL